MEKIRKILAPTDLSEFSCIGLQNAFEMARKEGAEVIVCNVIALGEDWFAKPEEFSPVRDLLGTHERQLINFLRDKLPNYTNQVEIRRIIEFGAPHANIVAIAEREGADLIVMSTHGRTGIEHFLLGSVTEKVVARAHCPVLVVPAVDRKRTLSKAA